MKKFNFFLIFFLSFLSFACQKKELPVYGQLQSFTLTNQDSRETRLQDYQGKVWAANFIFTSCAGTCPLLTQKMKRVQDAVLARAKKDAAIPLRIVSFSVDPERDTPEALKEYARRYEAEPAHWTFLTGPLDQIRETVVRGFKVSMEKVPLDPKVRQETVDNFDLVHSEKFVLVDRGGRIRGYYDADDAGIRTLIRDMTLLLKEPA